MLVYMPLMSVCQAMSMKGRFHTLKPNLIQGEENFSTHMRKDVLVYVTIYEADQKLIAENNASLPY